MRLIDADKMASDELRAYQNTFGEVDDLTDKINYVVHTKIQMLIRDTETLEAEPVIHRRWIPITKDMEVYRCSECAEHTRVPYRFCPYCGAKMDREENG